MLFHYEVISNIGNLILALKAWTATCNHVKQPFMCTCDTGLVLLVRLDDGSLILT